MRWIHRVALVLLLVGGCGDDTESPRTAPPPEATKAFVEHMNAWRFGEAARVLERDAGELGAEFTAMQREILRTTAQAALQRRHGELEQALAGGSPDTAIELLLLTERTVGDYPDGVEQLRAMRELVATGVEKAIGDLGDAGKAKALLEKGKVVLAPEVVARLERTLAASREPAKPEPGKPESAATGGFPSRLFQGLWELVRKGRFDEAEARLKAHAARDDPWLNAWLRGHLLKGPLEARDRAWQRVHAALGSRDPAGARQGVDEFKVSAGRRPELAPDVRGLEAALEGPTRAALVAPLEPAWKTKAGTGYVHPRRLFATPAGLLVYQSSQSDGIHLTAVRPRDGETAWDVSEPHVDPRAQPGPLVVHGDRAYQFVNGSLVARRVSDGALQWRRTAPPPTALEAAGDALYLRHENRLLAYDAGSGKPRWHRVIRQGDLIRMDATRRGAVVITWDGTLKEKLYLLRGTYRVRLLDARSGEPSPLLEQPIDASQYPAHTTQLYKWTWGPPVAIGDTFYLASLDTHDGTWLDGIVLRAFDLQEARLSWQTRVDPQVFSRRPSHLVRLDHAGGRLRVFFSQSTYRTDERRLRCYVATVDPETGEVVARTLLQDAIPHTYASMAGGLAVLGPYLSLHDPRTGSRVWAHYFVEGSAIVADGTLAAVTDQHHLAGFRTDRSPPTFPESSVRDGGFVGSAQPEFRVRIRDAGEARGARRVVWDNLDPRTIRVRIDGAEVESRYDTERGEVHFRHAGTPWLHLSPHAWDVAVSDRAGNRGRAGVKFTVDLEPPRIRLRHPVDNGLARLAPHITVAIADGDGESGVDRAWAGIFLDDRRVAGGPMGPETPWVKVLDEIPEGRHTARLATRDRVGNVAKVKWTFTASEDMQRLFDDLATIKKLLPELDVAVVTRLEESVLGILATQENTDRVRRLHHATALLLEAREEAARLCRDYAETVYEYHAEIYGTAKLLRRHIQQTEGKDRQEAEEKQKSLFQAGLDLVSEISQERKERFVEDFAGIDPRTDRGWKDRLSALFMEDVDEQLRRVFAAWARRVAGKRASLQTVAEIRKHRDAVAKASSEARTKWRDHMRAAGVTGTGVTLLDVLSDLVKRKTGLDAVTTVVSAFLDAKMAVRLALAARAARRGYAALIAELRAGLGSS